MIYFGELDGKDPNISYTKSYKNRKELLVRSLIFSSILTGCVLSSIYFDSIIPVIHWLSEAKI